MRDERAKTLQEDVERKKRLLAIVIGLATVAAKFAAMPGLRNFVHDTLTRTNAEYVRYELTIPSSFFVFVVLPVLAFLWIGSWNSKAREEGHCE